MRKEGEFIYQFLPLFPDDQSTRLRPKSLQVPEKNEKEIHYAKYKQQAKF